MLLYIYSRKSVYTGRGESIENQIEMCRQYAATQIPDAAGADVVVYEDEGFSGKSLDRPQFQRMLKDAQKTKPDYLVCYRLDRISRSVSDFAPLIEELNNRGISFICIKEKFDTSTPMGKAMMYIASVFAQLERETIAERVRDNMMMLARTGRWLGGTPPTGFSPEKVEELVVDGKIKTSCKLKFNPDEIATVRLMFEKFIELGSIAGVCRFLMKNGVFSRLGKHYSPLGIKEILQNPVYCIADRDARRYFFDRNSEVCFSEAECSDSRGLLSYNKRDYKKKSAPRQSMEKWIIAIGRHRGIVSGKEWVSVQNTLNANRPGSAEIKVRNDYALLSGLIYCPKCGEKLFSKSRSINPNLFDYICSTKIKGGTALCDCPNISGRQADDIVCDLLSRCAREDSGIFILLEALKRSIAVKQGKGHGKELRERLHRCNGEMDKLVTALGQSVLSPALVQRVNLRMSQLDSELAELRAELLTAEEQENATRSSVQPEAMAAALCCPSESFNAMTVREKRFLIRLLVQRIEWDGKDLHVFIYGE